MSKSEHDLKAWMKSAQYLPKPIRDFHDAKDIFKAMHEIIDKNEAAVKIGWMDGQIYTIDVFLWFMARRGYTLQRSRKNLPFRDLVDDIEAANGIRASRMSALIMEGLKNDLA